MRPGTGWEAWRSLPRVPRESAPHRSTASMRKIAADEEEAERSEIEQLDEEQEDEDSAFRRADHWVLRIFIILVVAVVARMAIKDFMVGPEMDKCTAEQGKIPKHMHCVSRNGTRSFAEFLSTQGAKKAHPNYERERERVEQKAASLSGAPRRPATAAASAAARAGDSHGARSGKPAVKAAPAPCHPPHCEAIVAYDDDDVANDFYDPDVRL